jgi:hypothetical protein
MAIIFGHLADHPPYIFGSRSRDGTAFKGAGISALDCGSIVALALDQ